MENIALLREALGKFAEEFGIAEAGEPRPPQAIEARLEELDETLPGDLARLEPFGPGNPEPLFAIHGLHVVESRLVGRGEQHLKLFLSDGRRTIEAIAFGMAEAGAPLANGKVDVCGVPVVDDYWGPPQVQLRIEGLRPAE